jgi:F0F1-type ATP synthase membrane subunit c/vacuolar-type H+-ATPase subunit K
MPEVAVSPSMRRLSLVVLVIVETVAILAFTVLHWTLARNLL